MLMEGMAHSKLEAVMVKDITKQSWSVPIILGKEARGAVMTALDDMVRILGKVQTGATRHF